MNAFNNASHNAGSGFVLLLTNHAKAQLRVHGSEDDWQWQLVCPSQSW